MAVHRRGMLADLTDICKGGGSVGGVLNPQRPAIGISSSIWRKMRWGRVMAEKDPVYLSESEYVLLAKRGWQQYRTRICKRLWSPGIDSEHLREFSKKFKTALMVYSGAWGKLIHGKNQKQKISWHCPFKGLQIRALEEDERRHSREVKERVSSHFLRWGRNWIMGWERKRYDWLFFTVSLHCHRKRDQYNR